MKLRFGIPTLDDLVDVPQPSQLEPVEPASTGPMGAPAQTTTEQSPHLHCATSISILGPDGSGKSVLALHLASRYLSDCRAKRSETKSEGVLPRVLYISSDYRHDGAMGVWHAFGLNKPNRRQIPFERTGYALARLAHADDRIGLDHVVPSEVGEAGSRPIVDFLLAPDPEEPTISNVGFVDLARFTAGDDWNFTNSILSKLSSFDTFRVSDEDDDPEPAPHLVIIDSVAGFETYIGELDAYGLRQTRRARIAQSLRNSGIHAHLVFVVEEPKYQERLPEEYVTDIVLRLRSHREDGTSQRTIEVEKARGRNHALGEHPFEIRGPEGSSTGFWENPDAPRSSNAYVHVFHSLPHRDTLVGMSHTKGKSRPKKTVAPFGIHYLDQLLHQGVRVANEFDSDRKETRGLRSGLTSGLVGEGSTGKSALAEKFIAEGFRVAIEDAIVLYSCLLEEHRSKGFPPDDIDRRKEERARDAIARVLRLLMQPMLATADQEDGRPTAPTPALPVQISPRWVCWAISDAWKTGEETSVAALRQHASERRYSDEERERFSSLEMRMRAASEPRCQPAEFQLAHETAPKTPYSRAGMIAKEDTAELAEKTIGIPEQAAQVVKLIFRHPNLRSPGILLTTGDRTTSSLASRCYTEYLKAGLLDLQELFFPAASFPAGEDGNPHPTITALRIMVNEILAEQLIVRRFDSTNVSAAELFHVIQYNVIEAQRLIHGVCFPFRQSRRFPRADRIRLVIDDLKVLASLCPAIQADSSFLPFLTFFLEREGVTTLLVHTESVRPFIRPTDPLARLLQPLLKHTILTWGVPFQGRNRIAISVVPPGERDHNGIVRELELRDQSDKPTEQFPRVSRNFELYYGVEEGKPQMVPLAVFVYAATEGLRRYLDQENLIYQTQFRPIAGAFNGESGRVLWPVDASFYYALRDVTHLPWDVKAEHTIIDQVDGFWSLDAATGALASQREYLMADRPEGREDPFHLFGGQPLCRDKTPPAQPWQRRHFFKNSGYRSRVADFMHTDPSTPDRVPFTWDFSFLLVPAATWEAAAKETIGIAHPLEQQRWRSKDKSVGQVLENLRHANDKRGQVVSWRHFFGACKTVAEVARRQRADAPVPFDFACTSVETLASLFLEIWFSEYHLAVLDSGSEEQKKNWKKWLRRLSSPVYQPLAPGEPSKDFSLRHLFQTDETNETFHHDAFRKFKSDFEEHCGITRDDDEETRRNAAEKGEYPDFTKRLFQQLDLGALTLYKTWLLLLEVMDFASVLDPASPFEMKQPKSASPHAISTRHYYRTACEEQRLLFENHDAVQDGHYALSMPGLFSVRGDSFLASPRASRSRLVASHAMDLLCSRRANLTRMQMGVGLPVRDVLPNAACDIMRTALRARVADRTTTDGRPKDPTDKTSMGQVTYADLRRLGGVDMNADATDSTDPNIEIKNYEEWELRWLFRNGVPEYDRISRALQRWLIRLFRWTVSYRAEHALNWDGGLFAYDALCAKRFARLVNYGSFVYFGELCDYLLAELKAAERPPSE